MKTKLKVGTRESRTSIAPAKHRGPTGRASAGPEELTQDARDDEDERERREELDQQRPVVDPAEQAYLQQQSSSTNESGSGEKDEPERGIREADGRCEPDRDVGAKHVERPVSEVDHA